MCRMAHFGNCDPETADQEYCIFHKPNKSEEEAVEFYRKFLERFKPRVEEIEVSGREIKRLVFEERVDAKGFVFPEIPSVNIEYKDEDENEWDRRFSFEYAVFKKEGNFSSARFKGRIDFAGSTFESHAIFSSTTFEDIVYFGHSEKKETRFKKTSNFKRCVFRQRVNFEKVVFEGNVRFSDSLFYKDVRFHQSKFLGNHTDFSKVYFGGDTLFSEVKFKCEVIFEKSRFKGEAVFTSSLFLVEDCLDSSVAADFKLSVFEDISDFSKAEFRGDVSFDKTTFGRFATFVKEYENEPKPKFHTNVEFSNCDIRQGITLLGTNELDDNVAKIEKQFKSLFNLNFPQSIQEAARVQRLSFEKEGRREDADKMFILEMRMKREILKKTSKRYLVFEYLPEVVLADWVALYGTKGRRVLFWALSVILANGLLYFVFSKYLSAFKDPLLGIPIGTVYTNGASEGIPGLLNALYYSLVTFTTLGYGDMHPTGWLKALSGLEALTGAVFMALIVAVIARKWMR